MNELTTTKSNYELSIYNDEYYYELQNIQDQNEKQHKSTFDGFSDIDMVYWYIHQRKNIDLKKETNNRTKYEYKKELEQFFHNLLVYADDIHLDLNDSPNESLLKQIEARHLRRYQEWLSTKSPHVVKRGSYSPATLARKTTIIKSFFTFLYKSNYSKYNAAAGLKTASVRADDRPNRDLGPEQVTAILDALQKTDITYYTIVLTLVTTGLRNEELCNLTTKSFRYDYINNEYYFEVVGKGNKKRDVPIKANVLKKLEDYRDRMGLTPLSIMLNNVGDETPIFVTGSGKAFSPSYLSQRLKKTIESSLGDSLGVMVTTHSFRHAFAIISHMNKVDVYDIMRSLGHEKIDTTMIYLAKVTARSNNAIHSWKSDILGEHF